MHPSNPILKPHTKTSCIPDILYHLHPVIVHNAPSARCTFCTVHPVHHAPYVLCTLCTMHTGYCASSAPCTLCTMQILHRAPSASGILCITLYVSCAPFVFQRNRLGIQMGSNSFKLTLRK